MKKIVQFFITLLTITNFLCTRCNFNNGASTDGTNTNDNDSVLPGKDRVWWYQGFDNSTEVQEFITELKNTKKNEDFNFGISNFEAPSIYKHFSTTFSGHINNNTSHEEDIFNSTYDEFWIETIFNENTTILPIYNRFSIYFYPFYLLDNTFDSKKINYEFVDYYDETYEATFIYDKSIIMKVKLSHESSSQINKEQMIKELITNYKLIV